VILDLAILVEHRLVNDRQTHDDSIYQASIVLRGKNTMKKNKAVASLCSYLWPLITPSADGYITHAVILATRYLQKINVNIETVPFTT